MLPYLAVAQVLVSGSPLEASNTVAPTFGFRHLCSKSARFIARLLFASVLRTLALESLKIVTRGFLAYICTHWDAGWAGRLAELPLSPAHNDGHSFVRGNFQLQISLQLSFGLINRRGGVASP